MGRSWVIILLFATSLEAAQGASDATPREIVICDGHEQLAFGIWSWLAGNPTLTDVDAARLRIDKVTVPTADGRVLRGLRMRPDGGTKGAILVIQGNGWSATRLVKHLKSFQDGGFDVFVYDFRGYGNSKPGHATLNALLEDYKEVFDQVRGLRFSHLHIYAFSFGGIIALRSLASVGGWDSLIIDGTPSRIPSAFKCPSRLDPVENVPVDAHGILIISGGNDRKAKPAEMKELLDQVVKRGGAAWEPSEWAHPFEGRLDIQQQARQQRIVQFLASR